VIYSNDESLNFLKSQGKLNKRHERWVEFLKQFPYIIKHKKEKANIVGDVLSRRNALLSMLETKFFNYAKDDDFSSIFSECHLGANKEFYLFNQHLSKGKRFCITQGSLRESFIRKAHQGCLMGQFGPHKTFKILKEHFYWPHTRKHVDKHCKNCIACMKANYRIQPHGLYTPLPIPFMPWVDISMDFYF